ncbi:MAG: DUF4258 domain-containing protein [Planctomycetia bacterium]|nr:DUF4258 domain-containing protein [Planctomycetia bacterium]
MTLRRPRPGDSFVTPPYAQRRLAQRRIGRHEVEAVIRDPLTLEPSRHHPEQWVLTRTVLGRRLHVVVAPELVEWVVVAAWET